MTEGQHQYQRTERSTGTGIERKEPSQQQEQGTRPQPEGGEAADCDPPRSGASVLRLCSGIRLGHVDPQNLASTAIKKLLKELETDGKDQALQKHRALQLLEATRFALETGVAVSFEEGLTQSLVAVLRNHQTHTDKNQQAVSAIHRLQQPAVVMDLSGQNDTLSSLVSGAASRVSPAIASDGVAKVLDDVGPSCTQTPAAFRETLAAVTSISPSGMDEATMARTLYFLAEKASATKDSSLDAASTSLLGSLIHGRSHTDNAGNGWDLNSVVQVLEQDHGKLDWPKVALAWDFGGFSVKSAGHFQSLVKLYRGGAKSDPPLDALTRPWRNSAGQLSLMENMMGADQNSFRIPLDNEEKADAATAPSTTSNVNPDFFASMSILNRLLCISDTPALYHYVREICVKGLYSCPEVLLCALVRLQLNVASVTANSNNTPGQLSNNPKGLTNSGMQIKSELMMDLIPLFFRPNAAHRVQNGPAALCRLYAISPSTVIAACFKAWGSTAGDTPPVRLAAVIHIINIARLLPYPAEAVAALLNGSLDPEFSVAIAFVMSDNDYLQLKPWLAEKLSQQASALAFANALVSYLAKNYSAAAPRKSSPDSTSAPLVSIENMAISLIVLRTLDIASLAASNPDDGKPNPVSTLGENINAITDACINAFPTLRTTVLSATTGNPVTNGGGNNSGGNAPNNSANSQAAGGPSTASRSSDDVEDMATAYFQKIYTAEQSIGEVVEMLSRFKTSGNSKENEIFACMVHNLFDEYRFYSRYPPKELRITGILFGTLIQEQLVSNITLGIALRYVLEALRKPPSPPGTTTSSGKMFKFGMYALEQFKSRLHEWPQYCSHIVQIPHLREGYADLVAEIEAAMAESQNRPANSALAVPSAAAPSPGKTPPTPNRSASNSGTATSRPNNAVPPSFNQSQASVPPTTQPFSAGALTTTSGVSNLRVPTSAITPKPRKAEFGPKLGRAVTNYSDEDREFEAPNDSVLDRIQLLLNNLAPSNVEAKAKELKQMLDAKYFGWLGHFLVVKRISTQVNFHSLYLSLLDHLGEYGKGLVEASLDSVFHYIGKLLRSPKITTSSSERFYLKNLGIWLGQITLARNRPILQIVLDCKELLLQGYETGKLIAVAPFLAKTLEGAKNSVVFRPPNPWLMGLLGVFRSVYNVDGLKMNIKFEVEVLCKNLNIRLEEIPLQDDELSKRVAPVKERNPDFNIRSASQSSAPSGGGSSHSRTSLDSRSVGAAASDNQSSSGDGGDTNQAETVIPNLAAYVTVNPNLVQLLQQSSSRGAESSLSSLTNDVLKRSVPIAVDRAIREIISPVVERSVSIAKITTKEIVTKDFAMESDETRMRRAGQLMVANLAGSLALVTCRDPLRSSVSTHLRQLLVAHAGGSDALSEQDQSTIEQCVQICATDNLDLGCMLIEKAAKEKAVRDVDEALATALNARQKHREQTGQPFYDLSIFGSSNQPYPRSLPDQLRPSPGGLRTEHFQLYESFQRTPRQNLGSVANANGSSMQMSRSVGSASVSPDLDPASGPSSQRSTPTPPTGVEALSVIANRLDSSVSTLLTAAGSRAPEIKLSMLRPEHQINQILSAVKQVMPNLSSNGVRVRDLSQAEQEAVLGFSQGIFKRLYELSLTEPLRLEALVALLEGINLSCPKLGKDIGTWATYAPTNTEGQRRLHRTVLLLLIRSNLLAVNELDAFLAARADNGRNAIWVDFSQVFIRTALMERISIPSDFPKLIELMTRIAEGRSQASAQVIQAYRKPILRMLEETRVRSANDESARSKAMTPTSVSASSSPAPLGVPAVQPPSTVEPVPVAHGMVTKQQPDVTLEEISSLSTLSLSNMSQALKKIAISTDEFAKSDPQGSKQHVISLIDSWIRFYGETSGSENGMAPFLQVFRQFGVGKIGVHTERFIRLATSVVVEASLTNGATSAVIAGNGRLVINYTVIDVYSKLLLFMFRHLNTGGNAEQIALQRLSMLNKILSVVIRTMMWSYEKASQGIRGNRWDQRPWFRILLNLIIDVNKPDPALDPMRLTILSVFGATLHVCQPLVMPSFAFSWFELVSHRHFLPNLLLAVDEKGWSIAHELLVDFFLFLEPHLRRGQMTPAVKKMYEGTLRVLLVLLHDFPSFLVVYHLSFCNVIPETCIQLRNLVLAASPKGMSPPDPFKPNLKIDLLPEIKKSPVILSNVIGPIEKICPHLDSFLKDGQSRNFLNGLPALLVKEDGKELDAAMLNSLVLYVGMHALARIQNGEQISLSRTPEIEVFKKLMEFTDRRRYICLNAIADQLRYPSSHTHYFSCVMLYLFSESADVGVKEQITRVLLERLILHRPHPWGLLVTFIELIKNQRYAFWTYSFTRCATEIEKVFENVARSCMPPSSQRSSLTAGGDE